ncbi:hypothetical protein BX666DRAFT_2019811 [Dichotomocladium elegans]|nr:hypothetical protein BX666DRAFT_2019811 [Dichotomocladium elegans]
MTKSHKEYALTEKGRTADADDQRAEDILNEPASDDDDNDSFDWEQVDVPIQPNEPPEEMQHDPPPVYRDVEVTFEAPRAVLKKSKWEQAYQRNMREWLNHSHIVLLVAHFQIRNAWCSLPGVQLVPNSDRLINGGLQSVCLSCVPNHIQDFCSKKEDSDKDFKTSIKWLLTWWKEYFRLTGMGPQTRAYDEFKFLDKTDDNNWTSEDDPTQEKLEKFGVLDAESIPSSLQLMQKLTEKAGFRDTSAELFTAILRALSFEARLVVSLQPVPYRIPTKRSVEEDCDETDDMPAEKLKFPLRTPRPQLQPGQELDEELKLPKAKPPTVWTEVYNPHTDRWICVDPIRGLYDLPRAMQPSNGDRRINMSCVLSFFPDGDGCIDVTRRYTNNITKALRLRERELTKREKDAGMRSWWTLFYNCIQRKNWSRREIQEQEEMEKLETREPMPTSISAFNNHPLYALERHLKKFEVLHPKKPILGHIKGETIYPRSCVKMVHTPETWMKKGRVIRSGEEPMKYVNARAVTLEKKRIKELAKQEGHDLQVACYGEWQTEAFRPSPVINGIVPRNSYGRVDLFTADMLPKGGAHIPINGIAKIARKIGIDYAEAVVDFEFVRHRSVPVTNGIVIAQENKEMLMEAWDEYENAESNKAIEKHEKQVYERWRKLILGVLIKSRLDRDYGIPGKANPENSVGSSANTRWESFLKDRHRESAVEDIAGGGFVTDEQHAGGFVLSDEGENEP